MADYAGAVAAIKARFAEQWVSGAAPRTPVLLQNENPGDPWPPVDGDGNPAPFVYFEVIGNGSTERGQGTPGDKIWLYMGHIHANVLVPTGQGDTEAHELARLAGEIFRAQSFYNSGEGAIVRCGSPTTDGGEDDADEGNYYRVTMSCPFEFFYRG